MPKLRLNVFDVFALLDPQAGIGVPQIVEPNGFQLGILQTLIKKSVDHVVVVDRLPCPVWKNKIQIGDWTLKPPALEGRHGGRAYIDFTDGCF